MGLVFQFAWTLAAAFFLLSVLVAAVGFPRWRRRERADAAETVRTLRLLKSDTSHAHEMDAL
jgi:membrane protein implicated in regulation of membrane protease activity